MKIILGAALVVLIALLGSRRTFTRVKLPLGARHLYLTGTEYALIGFCLGDRLLGLLDQQSLVGLNPLLYLSLGWIGLMFGIQLDVQQIARFPRHYFQLTVIQATVTLFLCFVPFSMLFYTIGELPLPIAIGSALALGAIAVPTGQSSLALVVREHRLRQSTVGETLAFVAGLDAVVGLLALGFVYGYWRTTAIEGSVIWISLTYLLISLGLGGVMGVLLHFLTRLRCTQEELLLFTVGTVVFTTGAAAYVGVSPLFVTAVGGFAIANGRGAKVRILRALTAMEKPFYIVVLIIGGAMVTLQHSWYVLLGLAGLFIILRFSGKTAGGWMASRVLSPPTPLPRSVGLGLISQGGISVAMVVSFHQTIGGSTSGVVLAMALVALLINELLSPRLAQQVIGKGG